MGTESRTTTSLASALEAEHRDIDTGIETFAAGSPGGTTDSEPLRHAMDALRRHIYVEEEQLFPPLREAGLVAPIFVMLREHAQMWETLDALESALDGGTGEAARRLSHQLAVQLLHHNPKEEQVVYAQADQVLPASVAAKLGALLQSAELPPGWVAQRARG